VVAALEGPLRGGRRSRRDAVPRPAGGVAVVADGAEPDLPRGRALRGAARAAPPPRVESRRHRPARARGRLADRDAALAAAPRAALRARAPRRRRRLHGADGAPARHPRGAPPAFRHPGLVLRRRRSDEPARIRRHGHRLQLLPRRRAGRVRPRRLELRGRARAAARAGRAPSRGRLLGGRPGALPAAAGREGARRLLLRLRRQVPARVDGGARRGAEPGAPGRRLRARRRRYRELLADPAQAEELGRRARERLLEEHTYVHRAQQLLSLLGLREPVLV
jgi:hypothetical protein